MGKSNKRQNGNNNGGGAAQQGGKKQRGSAAQTQPLTPEQKRAEAERLLKEAEAEAKRLKKEAKAAKKAAEKAAKEAAKAQAKADAEDLALAKAQDDLSCWGKMAFPLRPDGTVNLGGKPEEDWNQANQNGGYHGAAYQKVWKSPKDGRFLAVMTSEEASAH